MQDTVLVNGKKWTIHRTGNQDRPYIISGPRTSYRLWRTRTEPGRLFACNGGALGAVVRGLWFRDTGGELRQVVVR